MSPIPPTPLDLPKGVSRVLLVGGTFDPPHRAHEAMAAAGRRWMESTPEGPSGRTVIVLVPAARSPFKAPPVAADADRVALVRAMAADLGDAIVWTDEIDRARPGHASYWVESLERAHRALVCLLGLGEARGRLPDLSFLLGADQAVEFHRWRAPRRVLELARPVIVLRSPLLSREALHAALKKPRHWAEGEIAFLLECIAPATLQDVSATSIRDRFARGEQVGDGELSPAVSRAIAQRGLYPRASAGQST